MVFCLCCVWNPICDPQKIASRKGLCKQLRNSPISSSRPYEINLEGENYRTFNGVELSTFEPKSSFLWTMYEWTIAFSSIFTP